MAIYQFKVPGIPKSINSIYKINYNTRQVYLSEEGRLYKTVVKMYSPPLKFEETALLQIKAEVYTNWYYKNGKLKKQDVQV